MNKVLHFDLMRFALSKKTVRERLRYSMLCLVFYPFLARKVSAVETENESAASSQAGDDIYPLF